MVALLLARCRLRSASAEEGITFTGKTREDQTVLRSKGMNPHYKNFRPAARDSFSLKGNPCFERNVQGPRGIRNPGAGAFSHHGKPVKLSAPLFVYLKTG